MDGHTKDASPFSLHDANSSEIVIFLCPALVPTNMPSKHKLKEGNVPSRSAAKTSLHSLKMTHPNLTHY